MLTRVICFLLLFALPFCGAQAMLVQQSDSRVVTVKHVDSSSLAKYKAERDFNYNTEVAKEEGQSLFGYITSVLWNKFFHSEVGCITASDVVVYALIAFAAIMLIIQVFKVRSTGMFAKGADRLADFKVETENLEKDQFDKLIEEAKTAGNYRLAVRLLYLKMLKAMSDAGLIKWQRHKTNFEYYYELKGENIRSEFHTLTLVFESVWYGHHEITAGEFDGALSGFNN